MPITPLRPHDSSLFSEVIASELALAEKECSTLPARAEMRRLQQVVLALCILANIVLFVVRPDYIVLFIAASFYLNMIYFLTLLIPTSPGAVSLQKPEITRFHAWLWENGIRSGTRQFTRIFVNAFFMNCRTLTFPLGLLFSIDIVFTLIVWYAGLVPGNTALFVIAQSFIIITFYTLVWKVEPFTAGFAQNLDRFKSRLSRDLPPSIISLLFLTGFLAVVFLFLTSIILLPGITLNTFLTESGLQELAHLVSLLAVLAVSQYFIVRTLHGQRSRVMASRLMDYRLLLLKSLERDIAEGSDDTGDIERRYEMTSRLLESRIYRITRSTLAGAFPVCVVDPDFSVMMDTTTLTAIKGYIREDRNE